MKNGTDAMKDSHIPDFIASVGVSTCILFWFLILISNWCMFFSVAAQCTSIQKDGF